VTRVAAAVMVVLLGVAGTASAQAPRGTKDAAPKARETEKRDGAAKTKDGDGKAQPVTVDADKMERYGKEGLVVFSGSVVARQNNSVQYADRMEVYFDERGERIVRTVSTGSVKIITRDCRTGTAKRAEYFDLEQRLVLSGGARVWEDENVVTGDTITIFLSQDRSVVQGGKQDRVKAVFYPREKDGPKDGAVAATKKDAKASCVN
jgi:lipopolysaccharide export system protein LptA